MLDKMMQEIIDDMVLGYTTAKKCIKYNKEMELKLYDYYLCRVTNLFRNYMTGPLVLRHDYIPKNFKELHKNLRVVRAVRTFKPDTDLHAMADLCDGAIAVVLNWKKAQESSDKIC